MSQPKYAGAFVTMATRECVGELALFVASVRAFHPSNPIVIGTTSKLRDQLTSSAKLKQLMTELESPIEALSIDVLSALLQHDRHVHFVPCLDQYGTISRRRMEREVGCWYPTRHCDFMMEKANLLEWVLTKNDVVVAEKGALFLDSDITFLHPHPEVPRGTTVMLSAHGISATDERLFGTYNGGYVWTNSLPVISDWKRHTHRSRYFDQASLEDVATAHAATLKIAPPTINYGYWRMFQAPHPVSTEVGRFRVSKGAVEYLEQPLQSVHTHFMMPTTSRSTLLFNRLVAGWAADAELHKLHQQWAPVEELLRPWRAWKGA